MRGRATLLVLGTMVGSCLLAAPALAQPAPPAEQRQSILQIMIQGIEIPTYFIVAGSVAAIALIIEHFLNVRRPTILPPAQVKWAREQIENRNFRESFDKLKQSSTFFARIMTASLLHARHGFEAMRDAALEKSGELSGRMFRKAEYLSILGNLGPLLGLLGTVWGMIEAFGSLGAAGGGAGAGELATGISKALVNTLLGLALAIVALGFFGVCRNRIDSLTTSATVEALNLLEYFRTAGTATPSRPAEPRRSERPPVPPRAETAAPPTAGGQR